LTQQSEVPFLILRGGTPSFEELAWEADALLKQPESVQLPFGDRAAFQAALPKLRVATKWSFATGWSLPRFLMRVGLLRYGVWLGVGALAVVLTQEAIARDDPIGTLVTLIMLLALAFGIGSIVSALRWQGIMDRLNWAIEYRLERMQYEESLRSLEGLDGWRMIDNLDGSTSLVRLDRDQ